IRRSAVSISSNLVEGYNKTKKEFSRYIDISQASLEETKYHLILSRDLGYLKTDLFDHLILQTNEIGKMLWGLKRSLK
ncbi:MAG: four helix bundle protein, partial [Candidatus Omnitrophica bacterium]|nr:four helix bundle protein [Candidatus Omnitrophota bacterium]